MFTRVITRRRFLRGLAAAPYVITSQAPGGPGKAPASKRITLATSDTQIQVEAHDNLLRVASLKNLKTGTEWISSSQAAIPLIASVDLDGKSTPISWRFREHMQGADACEQVLIFASDSPPLKLHSVWRAYPGKGPIEHRIDIVNQGTKTLLLPLQRTLVFTTQQAPGHTLEHWWVDRGGSRPAPIGTHHAIITPAYQVNLESLPERNRPIPWSTVQDVEGRQGFYVGIEFSGPVAIDMRAAGAGLQIDLALAGPDKTFRTRLSPRETFNAPPAFVGCHQGSVDDGANSLRHWVQAHLMPRSPHKLPLLTNNSWGSGMAVDDKLARQMMDTSAEMGMELFGIDAGWFRNVGDWQPHAGKFPNGLASLADYAHAKGMLFGLWIGWAQGGSHPGAAGTQDVLCVLDPQMKSWFTKDAPAGWKNRPFTGETVCLGEPKAAEWCLNTLRRCVKDYKLDLLEHDQVMIVCNCGRTTHLHTSFDTGYRAAHGYYGVYDALRAENPTLLFENCVNGGQMVDYGVVRRTHYICITDIYDPLSNRKAFYDSSYALPPCMCECYIDNHPGKTPANFVTMLRSGMMGWCTMMLDMTSWSQEQKQAGKRQFDIYKSILRPLIAGGDLYHVSERPDGVRWDGMQYVDPKTSGGVLFVFRGTTPERTHAFKLRGLDRDMRYDVSSEDGSVRARVCLGSELMQEGVTCELGEPMSSDLVFFHRRLDGK